MEKTEPVTEELAAVVSSGKSKRPPGGRGPGRPKREGGVRRGPGGAPHKKKRKAVQKKKAGVDRKGLVDQAIESIGSKLSTNEVKGTMGDLIRLLEYRKEMDEDAPREIEVKWIDDKSSD